MIRCHIDVIFEISHHKQITSLCAAVNARKQRQPCTTATIQSADRLSPQAVALWRDGGEELVNTQHSTAVQRECTHALSIHTAFPVVDPHKSTWRQFVLVSTEMPLCSEGAQSQTESNRGGQLSARWRFYSCSEESDHCTHVTERGVAVHRAFIPLKSPLCLQKRLLWDHTWKLMKT